MSEFHTSSFGGRASGLFSSGQIRALMRVEFDRSRRYGYPLVGLLIGVDRLENLHDLYGAESRREILEAIVELVTSHTRASDFLGCMLDDRILVLLTHLPVEGAEPLAARLLEGARRLRFEIDGRRIQVSLSVGVAHNGKAVPETFEELVELAEAGLEVAIRSGGDRLVAREGIESELRELQEELLAANRSLQIDQEQLVTETRAEQARREKLASARIEDALEGAAEPSPDLERIREEMLALARRQAAEERDRLIQEKVGEHLTTIDTLERRVAKLTAALGATEDELRRLAELKLGIDGLASIYREVQGLPDAETQLERKREMMREIFQANLALQDVLKSGGRVVED